MKIPFSYILVFSTLELGKFIQESIADQSFQSFRHLTIHFSLHLFCRVVVFDTLPVTEYYVLLKYFWWFAVVSVRIIRAVIKMCAGNRSQ